MFFDEDGSFANNQGDGGKLRGLVGAVHVQDCTPVIQIHIGEHLAGTATKILNNLRKKTCIQPVQFAT